MKQPKYIQYKESRNFNPDLSVDKCISLITKCNVFIAS